MTYKQVLIYKRAAKKSQQQDNARKDDSESKSLVTKVPVSKSYKLMASTMGGWLGFRGGGLINKATGSKLKDQNARLTGLILGILAGDFLSDKALNI